MTANVSYDAHTEPMFRHLNLHPVHEFYNMALLQRYQNGMKYSDASLTQLSQLTAKENVRDLRAN